MQRGGGRAAAQGFCAVEQGRGVRIRVAGSAGERMVAAAWRVREQGGRRRLKEAAGISACERGKGIPGDLAGRFGRGCVEPGREGERRS